MFPIEGVYSIRRFLLILSVVFARAVLANPADAQFKLGVQAAAMASTDAVNLDGTKGAGARLMLDPPLFPLVIVGSGVYYFLDCTDCSYYTASIAVQLRLPLPVVAPYVLAGYQTRREENAGVETKENGPMVGVGVQLNFGMSLFLEVTMELNEEIALGPTFDNHPIVIKGGIMFG